MLRSICLSLGLAALGALPLPAQSDAAIAKGIHDREVQWRTAISIGNWSAVETFMAPDFVATDGDGKRMDRGAWLKALQKGAASFAAVPAPDYKTLVYGKTAVHLGEANLMATGKDGSGTRMHVVWTDTWVRTLDGQWICLASQYEARPAT
jgi:ketosteroid isomerase-like protein